MYKRILIPTDGSERSAKAARNGVRLAKALGASVVGLFAAPPATPVIYKNFLPVGFTEPEDHARMIERTAREYLRVIEDAARAAGVSCVTEHVTNDFPADAIVLAAEKHSCDLVFMASHSREGLAAAVLGSQTHKVLTHSNVPVLIDRSAT
jgi:nucleotide-binding universal stress UspA family protein